MLSCPFKSNFGLDCPGCGLQRSFHLLINGEIMASIEMYPPLIPLLFTFVFLGIHLIKKSDRFRKLSVAMFMVTTALMIINYIPKIIEYNALIGTHHKAGS